MRIIAILLKNKPNQKFHQNSVHFVGNVTLSTLPHQHGSSALFTKIVSLYKSETATQRTLLDFKQIFSGLKTRGEVIF
jgi:hypothetical protein